jgi:DNA-binding CsgD family transcriptional regulator
VVEAEFGRTSAPEFRLAIERPFPASSRVSPRSEGPGASGSLPGLLGREAEKRILEDLIEAARNGLSGSIVFYGEAGMGKTALLEHAIASAGGLTVARVSGVEAESQYSFAALHRLLVPFLGGLSKLPGAQRDALRSAFGLTSQAHADVYLVGLATLSLLADAASTGGMLCTIDDTQWLDPESLQALAFVARRLSAEGVVTVFAARTSAEEPSGLTGLRSLSVGGLPERDAGQLLAGTVKSPLSPVVATRIVTETKGCPLALIELADELSAEQWSGADRLSEPIPIGRRLERSFRRRIDALSPQVQTFLLIASAETSDDADIVRSVANVLGCGADAESTAVAERWLTTNPRIEFRHPLIRSAVYSGSAGGERRRVHIALANAVDPAIDPDRRVRHLAAVAIGPDALLADELAEAAGRARERGGYAAEVSLLSQSADLTIDPTKRSTRLVEAASAALSGGSTSQAEALLARARRGLSDPLLLAEAQLIDGRMQYAMGQPAAAPAALLAAAKEFLPLDAERARESLVDAFEAYFVSGHMSVGVDSADIADVALSARRPDADGELTDVLLNAWALLCGIGYSDSIDALRLAGRRLTSGPISRDEYARWFQFGTLIADELLDDRMYSTWVARVEESSRKSGALLALQYALIASAVNQLRMGRLSNAEVHYAELLDLTAAMGGQVELYGPLRIELFAWRGDEEATRADAELLLVGGQAIGSAAAMMVGYHAVAILAMATGRYEEAFQAAQFALDNRITGWISTMLPIAVESGVRCGKRDEGKRALAVLEERALATRTPWALGLLERCRALLADDHEADHHYQESILQLQQSTVVVDLAWSHLVYGEWFHVRNQEVAATANLRTAYDSFSSMGASGFAERARLQLLAAGERVRRQPAEGESGLTARELQIAQLAALGATNPEIGAEVFLSSNTVDYHLKKVFRKLGVTSRRQLRSVLPS